MTLPYLIVKKSLSTSAAMSSAIKHVTIVGGGLMGSGIAQVAAQTGHEVTLVEINTEVLKKTESSIQSSLQRVAKKMFKDNPADGEKFVKETLGRVKTSVNVDDAVKNTDLVVEAIVENISVKHKLFSAIDKIAPQHTIFTSNTSSLSIQDIASVTTLKDRFGGVHFFNPVPVMKLLEVGSSIDSIADWQGAGLVPYLIPRPVIFFQTYLDKISLQKNISADKIMLQSIFNTDLDYISLQDNFCTITFNSILGKYP